MILGQRANEQNITNNRENRNWQEYMSNTAHGREVEDLRNAGLNPMLSALGSGAGTPSGNVASTEDLSPGLSKGFETAMAMRSMKTDLELKDKQIANTEEQTNLTKQNQTKTAFEAMQTQNLNNQIRQQTKNLELDNRTKKLQNEVLGKSIPSMLKKAKAEGDYSEVNQIMGIIKSGASSASDISDIIKPFKIGTPRGR